MADQLQNEDADRGCMAMGQEPFQKTGGRNNAFCGAVGTGGMRRGVSMDRGLKYLAGDLFEK